ncbi:MAG: BMP family ABC transporter substrate-binding protein [Treponema sp.]|nr:BMP family ABC transporter substrate-binding protein [Treponema sp.]
MRECGAGRCFRSGIWRRFLTLLCLAGLVFTGCENDSSWKQGKPLPKEKIKIGIIHPNGIGRESGYDYAHYRGILQMRRQLGLGDEQITRRPNIFDQDSREVENAIRDCIAEGANIILALSWGYGETCEKLAGQFPGVVFTHGIGVGSNGANFTSFSGKFYQARYLSGIVAGKKTKTNKIGYVAAMGKGNGQVTGGIDAFALGVESVNPAARVYVKVTHSWLDPMGETEAARILIALGCDVIAEHVNGPAAMVAAQNAGVWGIGYNSDMKADAPRAVLTSVVMNWEVYYTRLIRSIIDGDFTAEPYSGGIAEGLLDISPLSPEQVTPDTIEAVERARRRIIEGFNVFSGVFETNEGFTVDSEGTGPEESEILKDIHWYYRNVVEL